MRDQCAICFEVTLTFRRECCDAPVCDTCMSQHVTTKVASGVWMVVCPGEDCGEKLEEGELLALLHQPETRELYQRLKVDSNAIPNTKTCPSCKHITKIEGLVTTTKQYQKYGLKIKCENCAFDWCFQCHGPAHSDLACVIRSESPFQEWAGDKLYGEFANAVQCPQCKTYVQHDGGCNNMTCSVCAKEFCYLCGDKTCVHDGYVFGRHLPSGISLLSLDSIVDSLMDLEYIPISERLRENARPVQDSIIPAVSCSNFCSIWARSVLKWIREPVHWAERRSTETGKICAAYIYTLVMVLLLLFPISIPITMMIVVACPRSRSRLPRFHLEDIIDYDDVEHYLQLSRDDRLGYFHHHHNTQDDSDQICNLNDARLQRRVQVTQELRDDAGFPVRPRPHLPYMHHPRTLGDVLPQLSSSITDEDYTALRGIPGASIYDPNDITISLTPTSTTSNTEFSSHNSDSPEEDAYNVGEGDQTFGETSEQTSKSASNSSRLETEVGGSDCSSDSSVSSYTSFASSCSSVIF